MRGAIAIGVTDGMGKVVPQYLEGPFKGRQWIATRAMQVNEVRRLVSQLRDHRGTERLPLNEILGHLTAAATLLMRHAPFAQCDCTHMLACRKCRGEGWVTVDQMYFPQQEPIEEGSPPPSDSAAG